VVGLDLQFFCLVFQYFDICLYLALNYTNHLNLPSPHKPKPFNVDFGQFF